MPLARPKSPPPLVIALQTIRKLHAEIDNMKDLVLKLQARTLKLELAMSLHIPQARESLWPEKEDVP